MMRTHIGISLDGFLASASGMPAWDFQPTFDGSGHGYPEFMAKVGAVAMGRTSFDQGLDDWLGAWPWGDKPIFVLTSRPLPGNAPPHGRGRAGGVEGLAERIRNAGIDGDVQLLGGAKTVRAFLDAGALDRLGIVVLPLLLHRGIPLFDTEPLSFSTDAWRESGGQRDASPPAAFELDSQQAFDDGSMHLVYRPKR
jgi:dihydrofolate reductase